jgi:WD40 repeat protein
LDQLWNFECELSKGRNVSGLSWSTKPKYRHILAVSYGETDFESAQKGGAILIWSLKNPQHPDHVIETPTGVMCVAFSHTHHNLLAAGMYDGTVCIYDIGRRDKKPFLESGYLQKHTGPVWELRWVDQNSERGEKLVSISSDGRITQWMMKKGLDHTDLFKLKKVPNPAKQKDVKSEAFISRNASGFCFDFSPADSELYLCGTEEGNIHLCSRLYNHFLRTYVGHTEPVYRVKYCQYHPGIFLSASADWTLKLWAMESTKCLMSIQPGNTPMMDVCWSPAKPTVFGATTSDGKLLIYDMQQNQMEPSAQFDLGDDTVHMNSLAFADGSPVVMAGTSSGSIAAFTIHGLMSAASGPVMGDPVKQLETILMMGKEPERQTEDAES